MFAPNCAHRAREKRQQAKDIKKEMTDIGKKLKDNEKTNNLSEEAVWELGDRMAEPKQMLDDQRACRIEPNCSISRAVSAIS